MEMESHRKSREAMAAGEGQEDRLSSLPDDVLHSILGGFPLKDAVRTSALSRRWASLWLHALAASSVLDFTDRGFVRGQSPAQIVATVNRCLRIHGDAEIDVFRVAFSPFDAFRRDVVGWVADALGRGAKEVEVDLTQGDVLDAGGGSFVDGRAALELPGELFRAGNSLAGLRLGQCSLRDVPPDAAGLAGLRSLSLDHVDVTDEAVRTVVSNCRLLEFLSLRTCHLLTSVRISGERLRGLEIAGCLAVRELMLAAPALESFAFHGDIVHESDFCGGDGGNWYTNTLWQATPALRDSYLSHVGFGEYEDWHDSVYTCFLNFVAHARILTICSVGLLHIQEVQTFFELMVDTPNLEELQLLMDSIGNDDVTRIGRFLELINYSSLLLERLFVRLPGAASAPGDDGSVAPLTGEDTDFGLYEDIVIGPLRFIKVVNFRGTSCELRLLEFLLDRTPALEHLVLVTPEEEGTPGDDEQQQSGSMLHLKIIEGQVSMMRKASPEARIAVCRPREDGSRNPAHTTYYHEEKCSSGAVPSVNPCRLKFNSQ